MKVKNNEQPLEQNNYVPLELTIGRILYSLLLLALFGKILCIIPIALFLKFMSFFENTTISNEYIYNYEEQ